MCLTHLGSWPAWIWESIFRLVKLGTFSCCVRLAQPLPYIITQFTTLNFYRSGSLPNCRWRNKLPNHDANLYRYLAIQPGPLQIFWPQKMSNTSARSSLHLPIEARLSPSPLRVLKLVISLSSDYWTQRRTPIVRTHPEFPPEFFFCFEPPKTSFDAMLAYPVLRNFYPK